LDNLNDFTHPRNSIFIIASVSLHYQFLYLLKRVAIMIFNAKNKKQA